MLGAFSFFINIFFVLGQSAGLSAAAKFGDPVCPATAQARPRNRPPDEDRRHLLARDAGRCCSRGSSLVLRMWVKPDRNRFFWITIIVGTNVIGATTYAVFVLPRFARTSNDAGYVFEKQP